LIIISASAHAASFTAGSCSQANVQSAINLATDGDTVVIPAGTCSWTSGISFSKGIRLQGVSKGAVTLSYNAGSSATLLSITANASRSIEISNLRFIVGAGGDQAWEGMFVNVGGSGLPVLLHDNYFDLKNHRGIHWSVNKGVIWNNVFEDTDHGPTANAIMISNTDTSNWTTPDTLGMRDANGQSNVYIEDNTFLGVTTQALDPDSNSRVVIRHNLFDNSGMASHGADTSEDGTRHWELYDNVFKFTNFGDCSGAQTLGLNWYFYIRGGTGIIADNQWDDINSCAWGNKAELTMIVQNIRRNSGPYPCWATYPAPHQIGQSHNGISSTTDPVYIWGNTGTGNSNPGLSDYSPNECGSTAPSISQFLQAGRDFIVGTAKPGYLKYTYPHPLRAAALPPPSNTFYIRSGASGSTCTDWGANACNQFPSTLQRGATYYIAAGSYGSPTFSTALSGNTVITLKGATAGDHGSFTGWSDAYAVTSAPAVFKGITFLSGFWTLDGSVGSLSESPSAYGFLIDNTAGCADNDNGIALGNGNAAEFSNMTFKHIAFENCTGDIWSDGINTHGQILRWINSTVSDSLFEHWQGAIAFNGASANQNITIERNIFMNGHSSSHAHGEQINANGADVTNMVLRYNVFKDNGGTGTVVGNNSNIANSFIYGNLFIRDTVGNGIITGTSVGDLVNTMVYNNTFVGKVAGGPWVSGEGGTGNIARNNLIFGMDASAGAGVILDNNAYFQTTNTPTETNRQTGTNNPFVNASGGNYHLAAATSAGLVLSAPFNLDPNGNTRGADGVWDRGAYEFISGAVGSPCDLNSDGSTNVSDVQQSVNQAIGTAACMTGDINKDGNCTVVDVQRTVNAALGGQCVTQ
jgi:hypothetical protein